MKVQPKSRTQDILWPALPGPTAAQLLAMQFQLEQSQWWTAQELLQRQLEQASVLLAHAYRDVPFYGEYYRAQRYRPKRLLTPELWAQIPLLSREMVQAAGERLHCTHVPPHHGNTHEITTSGSTGRSISVLGTELSQFFWQSFTLREHHWHRRDLRGKLAVIRRAGEGVAMPPKGVTANGWGPSTDSVYKTGPSALLDINSSLHQQVEWLQQQNPDYLLSYPSNLLALAQCFKQAGVRLPRLREVRTLGEVVGEEVRKACREAWGVPLTDIYSCQEAGYLALQCPEHEHYHVQAENVLFEVLDDNNQPCSPGETGRVVITNLNNFATPLIRYDIGDYAEVGPSCPCGRGLPVLTRIAGRVRNLVTLPNGERHWPLVGSDSYSHIAPIEQFQLIQRTLEEVEVRLVVTEPLTDNQQATLTEHIQASLGYPFRLSYKFVDHIPRSPGGKFEDFISEVGQ